MRHRPCRRRPSHRRGFTLIELVASAVLASMLMAGVLSIVWSSLRELSQTRQSAVSQFPVTRLVEQLRIDLQNARGMAVDGNGMTLHGYLARDSRTLRPLMTPGRIRYETRISSGRRVLVRSTDGRAWDPIWFGFGSFRVDPLQIADPENEAIPEPETGGLPEIPLSFQITMTGDRGQVLWREVIFHHES